MHYRNGREAKNGDKIVQIGDRYNADGTVTKGVVTGVGVLYDAKPGNDHCNGSIAPIQNPVTGACLCDCLHVDDVAAMLKEKGLDNRPSGK
jgi:S1-C subfamily serine protease